MRNRWKYMHQDLTGSVTESAEEILEPFSDQTNLDAYAFAACYYHNWFNLIIRTVNRIDQGDAEEAYSGARFKSTRDKWKMVPMDIGYALYPDLMIAGCEEHLDQSIKKDKLEYLKDEVMCAYQFSERYGADVSNLKKAQEKKAVWLMLNIALHHQAGADHRKKTAHQEVYERHLDHLADRILIRTIMILRLTTMTIGMSMMIMTMPMKVFWTIILPGMTINVSA